MFGRAPLTRPAPCPRCDAEIRAAKSSAPVSECPHCKQLLITAYVASFWQRLGANVIDLVVLLCTAAPLNYGLVILLWPLNLGPTSGIDFIITLITHDWTPLFLRSLPFLTLSAVYFGLFWSTMGHSPGQMIMGLRVVDDHGNSPAPRTVALRVVAGIIGLIFGGLGWIWSAFDMEGRAFHDHIAKTYLITRLS